MAQFRKLINDIQVSCVVVRSMYENRILYEYNLEAINI